MDLFHEPLDLRARRYCALADLAPNHPGPDRQRALTLAELTTLREPPEGFSLGLLTLLAEQVRAHGDVECGHHGFAVYDVAALATVLGCHSAAVWVLRLAGATAGRNGRWSDQEFKDSDEVRVSFPPDFAAAIFADLAERFAEENDDE